MPAYHNQFPSLEPGNLRVALVGECPGTYESMRGIPFCGPAGQQLDRQLAKVGLLRARCYVGNVANAQPPRNDFAAFNWNGPEVQGGIAQLLADLRQFAPNVVVAMGNVPNHLFNVGNVAPPRRKSGAKTVYDWPRKITDWRGSLFYASVLCDEALHFDLPAVRQPSAGNGKPTEPGDAVIASIHASPAGALILSGEPVQPVPSVQAAAPRWKVLATVHPAFCLRAWSEWFNLQADLRRAVAEARTPTLTLPELDFAYGPAPLDATAILERLRAIKAARAPVGWDIEGSTLVACQAFAESPSRAFCIVTDNLGEHSAAIWHAVTDVLEDPLVPKWTWNAHHEVAVMKWAHGITVRGVEDGMARWFERWPELPKGLKYAASILTRQPCWTEGISFDDDDETSATAMRGETFYRYNATDAARTLELALHPQLQLTGVALERYQRRLRLVDALNWASCHGIRFDQEEAKRLRAQLEPQLWTAQARVNELAGVTLPANADQLLAVAAREWCHAVKLRRYVLPILESGSVMNALDVNATDTSRKPASPVETPLAPLPNAAGQIEPLSQCGVPALQTKRPRKSKPKPPPEPLTWKSAIDIANDGGADALRDIQRAWDANEPGRLADLLGLAVNVKSTKQVVELLDRLGLPKAFKRGQHGDESARTKDADVLLGLYIRTGHPVTVALLTTIALRTRLQELDRGIDSDGRIRCSFISCGTTTDRTTSKKWLTGSGGNLQTVPRAPVNFRRCYVPSDAPDGTAMEWWKFDYTGADAWTVAARCAQLGDDTMLADLQAGLRIPTLLALTLEGVAISRYSRPELAAMCKAFKRDWRDLAFKRATYGTMYGMTPKGVRRVAVADSFVELGEPRDPGLQLCARIQMAMHARYWGIAKWHAWVDAQLKTTGKLTAASGLTREFFGRRIVAGTVDESTRKEAYAYEPQCNTTYCLNRAVDALWTDPENRDASGEPIIQLLLVVHDEGSGQSPATRRDWVRAKIAAAMAQPLTFTPTLTLTIPAVLKFGTSWGSCTEP